MNVYVRTLSCAALLGTALLGLGQYRPPWAARYCLDWWSLPEMHEQIECGQRELDEKQAQCDVVAARLTAKQGAIDALLDGRLTLAEAAARFRRHNASPGAAPTRLGDQFPGATEGERLCRQVIRWAEDEARRRSPDTAAPAHRRLEAELGRLLARDGGIIRLPE